MRMPCVWCADKNTRFVRNHNAVLDEVVHAFLRWMLTLRAAVEITGGSENLTVDGDGEDSGVTPATVFEALAHVLRIYLASLSDQLGSYVKGEEGASRSAVQQLHDRCRAVGICAVLRAFHVLDDERGDASERQEEIETSSPHVVGHLGSLKRLRAVGKGKATSATVSTSQPVERSASDERRVLRALSRAVVEMVRCKC